MSSLARQIDQIWAPTDDLCAVLPSVQIRRFVSAVVK